MLLTQAAKKRAQIEVREARIKEMESRMPCSACKAHGRTVCEHWHGDAECPFGKKGEAARSGMSKLSLTKSLVTARMMTWCFPTASTLPPWMIHAVMVQKCGHRRCAPVLCRTLTGNLVGDTLALSDTCCVRTVAGSRWMDRHLRILRRFGEEIFVVDEARPFQVRRWPEDNVIACSDNAAAATGGTNSGKDSGQRCSASRLPLLLSKSDLKKLGMVMDLDRGLVNFRGLDIQVPLRETKTGLCGFQIQCPARLREVGECPLEDFLDEESELVIPPKQPYEQVMVTDLRQGSQGGPEHVRATRINVVKCEDIAQKLYHDCDFNNEVLLDLVRLLPIRVSKRHRDINGGGQPANEAWVAGFYAHGGWTGVTRRTTRYPQVVRFLNAFMRHHVGDEGESWTSLTLMKNVSTDIHVDCHNQKESSSTTLNFGEFSGGQLWIADDSVDATACVWKKDKDGNRLKGRLHDTYRRPTRFDPHAPHATHTWQGERWCLSVYSVRTAVQVSDEIREALQKLKFPFRKTAASRTLGNEQSVTFMSSNHQEPPQSADDMGDDDEHSGIASPIKLRSQTCQVSIARSPPRSQKPTGHRGHVSAQEQR